MSEFNWVGLIVFSIVLLATPGPAVISLFYSGLNYGFKKSLPYFFGVLTGFIFNLLASVVGAGVMLEFSTVYTTLKFVMLGYIFYLAYKIATSAPLDDNNEKQSLGFFHGVLLNLLNPKAYVAALSSVTYFSLESHYIESAFFIVITNFTVAFVFQGLWCFSGQHVRQLFARPKWYKRMNVSLAILLVLSVVWSFLH